jgi:NurA-like 5'-3' nuclease
METIDDWTFSLAQERRIPPVGAVSYLFRLHKNTPIMRLDVDLNMWEQNLKDNPKAEDQLFADLDYSGHDQRAYGYPYPIKASHDRSRLTQMERAALRKQIIEAAVAAGMKRALFRDVSTATGHK